MTGSRCKWDNFFDKLRKARPEIVIPSVYNVSTINSLIKQIKFVLASTTDKNYSYQMPNLITNLLL